MVTQQELPACKPILTPKWVSIGVSMFPYASYSLTYDKEPSLLSFCVIYCSDFIIRDMCNLNSTSNILVIKRTEH
ncbi:hypothetical protein Hanom_Chr02g00123051 [Helianthus anomalus]